jgi:hypothetical protein
LNGAPARKIEERIEQIFPLIIPSIFGGNVCRACRFMSHNGNRRRKWASFLVALSLSGALPLAMLLNRLLGEWSFISFTTRNIIFLLTIAFVFGITSVTEPLRIGAAEFWDGCVIFGLFVVIGWSFLLMFGLGFGWWSILPPVLYFVSLVAVFQGGRWVGELPRRTLPQDAAEG